MIRIKYILIILFIYSSVFGQFHLRDLESSSRIIKDIDFDNINDTIYIDQEKSKLICILSRKNGSKIESGKLDIHSNSGIRDAKNGFYFDQQHRGADYSFQFRYSNDVNKFRLIGVKSYEYGSSSSKDARGRTSGNLLTGDFIGEWKYFDEKSGKYVRIPTVKIKVLFEKMYLEDFNKKKYSDYCHKAYELSCKYRDKLLLEGLSKQLSHYLSLRDYFTHINDTVNVKLYKKKIKELSTEIRISKEYSNSLIYLVNSDAKNKSEYLEKYIKKQKEQIAEYSSQSDNIIAENESLKADKNYIIFGSLFVVVLILFLFYVNKIKSQNEKLVLENDQQKLNEELYLASIEHQQKLKTTQIEERNRIAEELHDNILSKLFGVRLKLGFFPTKFDDETQKEYEKYTKELQNIEKDIRDVSHQLHANSEPYVINFEDALMSLLEDKKNLGELELIFNKDKSIYLDDLEDLIKINLYRVLQEILQNIIKHANANQVLIEITQQKNKLHIVIQDNGIGFEIKKVKKGLGIKTIISRVKKINGKISFDYDNNQTTISIIFPYKIDNE